MMLRLKQNLWARNSNQVTVRKDVALWMKICNGRTINLKVMSVFLKLMIATKTKKAKVEYYSVLRLESLVSRCALYLVLTWVKVFSKTHSLPTSGRSKSSQIWEATRTRSTWQASKLSMDLWRTTRHSTRRSMPLRKARTTSASTIRRIQRNASQCSSSIVAFSSQRVQESKVPLCAQMFHHRMMNVKAVCRSLKFMSAITWQHLKTMQRQTIRRVKQLRNSQRLRALACLAK